MQCRSQTQPGPWDSQPHKACPYQAEQQHQSEANSEWIFLATMRNVTEVSISAEVWGNLEDTRLLMKSALGYGSCFLSPEASFLTLKASYLPYQAQIQCLDIRQQVLLSTHLLFLICLSRARPTPSSFKYIKSSFARNNLFAVHPLTLIQEPTL